MCFVYMSYMCGCLVLILFFCMFFICMCGFCVFICLCMFYMLHEEKQSAQCVPLVQCVNELCLVS